MWETMTAKDLYWQIAQRSLGVYTLDEQKKIQQGKVAVVGIGCDGGMDAYILARMGVGKLTLIDFDLKSIDS